MSWPRDGSSRKFLKPRATQAIGYQVGSSRVILGFYFRANRVNYKFFRVKIESVWNAYNCPQKYVWSKQFFYKWLKKLLEEKNSKKISFGCKIALIFTILRLEKMHVYWISKTIIQFWAIESKLKMFEPPRVSPFLGLEQVELSQGLAWPSYESSHLESSRAFDPPLRWDVTATYMILNCA